MDVLVIGAGGLGCTTLPLLAARGLEIRVVDDDVISLSNLQRQLLFRTEDVGEPKATAAARRVRELVPGARIHPEIGRIGAANALAWVREARVVLDGSDNFATRFLVNDACVLGGTPLVHGGILRFTGQILPVLPGRTACYRCLFEEAPPAGAVPSCAEAGVLGALCGIVGATMVEAALQILEGRDGIGDALVVHDAWTGTLREVELRRDPRCAACGDAPTIRELQESRYRQEAA